MLFSTTSLSFLFYPARTIPEAESEDSTLPADATESLSEETLSTDELSSPVPIPVENAGK